jgi:carboxyl-terminal processing protease
MEKQPHLLRKVLVLLWLALISGAILGCHPFPAFRPPASIPSDAEPSFRLLAEAWNTIHRAYVDHKALNSEQMTYGAISGMVDSLGDTGHSRFLTPEMAKREKSLSKGKYEGIGAEIRMKNGWLVIVAPIDGSPAYRAGLKPGDIILKVDEEDVSGLPLDQAIERILGPAGTKVKLTIFKPHSGQTKDILLVRSRVTLHPVAWQRLPGKPIAHVRIMTFSKGVTHQLRNALSGFHQEGLKGMILDLRNNPGGLYEEAILTASQFLGSGNVLLEKDAAGRIMPVPVRSGGLALTVPMVVLINGGTSSGAEIVAGALQDAHRAKLVGEKTFGAGTVLETFSLSDGSALMLATEEWLTPAGHVIWHQGISPDVVVSLPPEVSPFLPGVEKRITVEEFQKIEDIQLIRALDLLLLPKGSS